jgi:glutaredoxin
MAEAPSPTEGQKTEQKPDPAFEELKTSLEDISSKLESYDQKLEDLNSQIKTIPTPTLEDKGEGGYVEKGWTPKDWNEVYAKSEEIASKTAQAKVDSFATEQKKAAEEKSKEDAAINTEFDRQLGELEKQGKIPKVVNEADQNDPGKAARRELFQLGIQYESTNLIKMSELRDKVKSIPPIGSQAPVGSSSGVTEAPKTVNYDDIHKKSFDALVREEFPK